MFKPKIDQAPKSPIARQKISDSHKQRKGSRYGIATFTSYTGTDSTDSSPPVLSKPRKFSAPTLSTPPTPEEHNRIYRLSPETSQEQYVYKQVLRCLVLPNKMTSVEQKATITDKELLERLRQAFGVERHIHDAVLEDVKAEKVDLIYHYVDKPLLETGQDFVESDQCTVEEFHSVVKSIYRSSIKATSENPKVTENGKPKFQQLPNQLQRVIAQFATENHFRNITKGLVEAVVIMELCSDKYSQCVISEKLIRESIVSVELDWQNEQTESQRLKNVEMAMFDKAATDYTKYLITSMKEEGCVPKLFPASEIRLKTLNKRVSLVVTLLKMDIWQNSVHAKKEVVAIAIDQIEDSVKNWVIEKLTPIEDLEGSDNIINQATSMVAIIKEATEQLAEREEITAYFGRLGVDYFKIVSLQLDKRLSTSIKDLMPGVDRYQVKHHKHHEQTLESSNATLTMYNSLQGLCKAITTHVGNSEVPTQISSYQCWFEHAVMFWLQIFKTECIKRMERALDLEKDVIQVTSLVKHSNSYVDVVSCFTKCTSEWNDINFTDADIAVLGCTKITDTICDGATQYAQRMHMNLEKNGYYDFIDNAQFDVTDQLCITLNNVMHVRKYIEKLPRQLNFEDVCRKMSEKYENENIGKKSSTVLRNLLENADYEMSLRCRTMIQNIVAQMNIDMLKLVQKFTQKAPEKVSSIDPLIIYLDENIKVLDEKLESSVFSLIVEEIFYSLVEAFSETTLEGKETSYYRYLNGHLETIRSYVQNDVDSETIAFCETYCLLKEYLDNHERTAEELALIYYKGLYEDMKEITLSDCGYITICAACKLDPGSDTRTIVGRVCSVKDLPGVTKEDTIDPFVTISIHPHLNLPESEKLKQTKVHEDSRCALLDEDFQFDKLNKEVFKHEKGMVLIFTVWHRETVIPNDFIGEAIVLIGELPLLNPKQQISDLRTTTLPLSKPPVPHDGPYLILQQRKSKDRDAQKIINMREVMAGWEYPTPAFSPLFKAIAKAKGKK